ncbi:MAG: hypothetical protein EOM52_03900 [Clostridia bacterium]|nr:hypothetical protein [Clostridia bacterium]
MEEQKKKPNILLRLLAFLVTLALMLGAVALVVYRDELNFDALKRYFAYRSLEKSDAGQTESFQFGSGGKGGYLGVGDDLMVWSTTGVRLYSPGGVEYLNESLMLSRPAATANGGVAVVYDAGGCVLRAYSKREQVFSLDNAQGEEILSARVNSGGMLAVTTRAQGYKGVVTVYDSKFEPKVRYRLSSRFVMDGAISDDGKTVAVLTLGQENGAFNSSLDLYAIDGDEPFATVSLGNNLILDLRSHGSQFWTVGESGLTTVGSDGAVAGQYDYGGRYLKAFSLGGDGFASLLLGKYRAGSGAALVTVDETGAVLATVDISDQVLDLAAAGRYTAVLTAGGLDIYTKDLSSYGALGASGGARHVVLRDDGTAFLVGGETARLYIPN